MKNGFKASWIICFLFFTSMVTQCNLEHKNPLDPENPDTNGKVSITITDPYDGQDVTMKYTVSGIVTPRAEVTVFVHPLATNEYWVQNFPNVESAGSWHTLCYFGTETQGIGQDFEVFAVTPKKKLEVGKVLYSFPENTNMSNIVTVNRPR